MPITHLVYYNHSPPPLVHGHDYMFINANVYLFMNLCMFKFMFLFFYYFIIKISTFLMMQFFLFHLEQTNQPRYLLLFT